MNLRNHLRNLRATFLGALMLLPFFAHTQTDVRAKIDADRRYLNYEDEKTLEKSRGYIREDSTFYIGYMYSGGFKFTRANDKMGFALCIVELEKAMNLIERDYDKQLRTRTNDIFTYMRVSTYQNDYCDIAYWLEQSYQNIEEPQKAFETVQRVHVRNLQMEQGIESFNTLAWIYHRNRMYTPKDGKQYSFLKNSVKENDSIANKYLDSALLKIHLDAEVNVGLFDASYLNRLYLYTYHYKAILMDYNLEIDSANFYYDELIRTGYYSSNNYAEFKMAMGEFPEADQFFHEAEQRDGSREKQTREYFYERGTLDTYRAHPEQADSLLKKQVEENQGTPGYGWHSIALSRALHYEGLTAESQGRINKASNFDELHIATTWGEEQYNLAILTLNYTNEVQFKQNYYFENANNYWLNPVNWYKSMSYSFQVNNQKLFLASSVASNPERKNVIYPLFSSENLVNFDEVWSMIDGFGNEYFIGIYKNLLENDKRPKLKKYFRYFLGKLYFEEGNNSEAIKYFEQVLNDPEINDDYQKLLYARSCEGMALASSGDNDKKYWTQKMYETFPQLVPDSDLKMEFRLDGDVADSWTHSLCKAFAWIFGVGGILISLVLYYLKRAGRTKIKPIVIYLPFVGMSIVCIVLAWYAYNISHANPKTQIISDLHDCNITFTNDKDVPVVEFETEETKDATIIDYTVRIADGSTVITSGSLRVPIEKTSDGGKLFAYRLFGIKKKEIGDDPVIEVLKQKEKK